MGDHIIRMSDVFCNQSSHSHELIKTLCLNPQCQQNSTLCSICLINTHLVCRSQVLQLKEIPQQLNGLQQLKLAIEVLQNKINHEFKKLLVIIEQSLLPISKYQDSPNFSNLNEIGLFLRTNPKQNIPNTIDYTITQIRLLLDNHDCQLRSAQQFIKQESFQSPNIQSQSLQTNGNKKQQSPNIQSELYKIKKMKSSNQSIKLFISCPLSCACGDNKPKYWVHEACGTQYQIDCNGDVNCQNGCGKQFIQDFGIKCQQTKDCQKFKYLSEVIVSFAKGLYKICDMEGEDLFQFIQCLNNNLVKRWKE